MILHQPKKSEKGASMQQPYINHVKGHALVLGGSGGIGAETIRALIANGVTRVSFTYNKNRAAADELVHELTERGIKAFGANVDLTNDAAFRQFLEDAVLAQGSEITAAVHTVGISPNTPFVEQTTEEWRQVLEVNAIGLFTPIRAIAERMKAKNVPGAIVVVTSTNGINSQDPMSAHYDFSKAGQVLFVKNIAEYYASAGIRINGVAPGWINTKMNDTLPSQYRKAEEGKIWFKRFAEPAEVANVIVFLAGSASSYITGQNIMVDGGYR